MARVMGVDLGKKRIGIAMSDEAGIIAQPLTNIKKTTRNKDIENILALASEHGAKTIVVGVPYNMDGSTGPGAKYALKFIELLNESSSDLQVFSWDERLSTRAVERVLIEGDVSRAKRKQVVDKLAASYILQGWMESRESPENKEK